MRELVRRQPALDGGRVQVTPVVPVKRTFDPLRLALFALTLLTVSRIHQHFSALSTFRPALALSLLALVYGILKPRSLGGSAWFRTWPAKVVATLGALACLSAPFGISFGASAQTILEDYSKVLIFAFLLMATIRGTRDLLAYVWAYVLSAAILVWMSVFVFGLEKANTEGLYRLGGLYSYDSNDVGVVLLVAVGLALLTFQVSRTAGKLVSVVTLVGIGVALARSGSRGAFVGLLAVAAALMVFVNRIHIWKRAFLVAATAAGLAVADPPGYWQQMRTVFTPTEDYNWVAPGGRRQIWLRGLSYMLSYPVFGLGIGNFGRAEATISERAKNWRPGDPGIRWSAPHNSFLEAGSELGVPGLLLWSSLVLGGIVAMLRLRRRLPEWWARGDREQRFLYLAATYLPVSLTGFAAGSFFVSFAFLDPVYILAAFMCGMYVCTRRKLAEAQFRCGPVS